MNPRYTCIVPECKVSGDLTIPKFSFPTDINLGQKWLNLVRNPILRDIPYRRIRDRRFKVCAEHFAENTSYATNISRTLVSGTLPTLKLPDSRNWEPIYIRDKEIDLGNLIGGTTIDNAFTEEFSSSFTYSDSSSILIIKDSQLPIRGRGDRLKINESSSKGKNNRRKYEQKTGKREPSVEKNGSGSDWEVKIDQDVAERRKKSRLELSDDDFVSVEETTDLKIERIACNSDDSEKGTDYEGFEEISSDDPGVETTTIFRNVYTGKGNNNEKISEYTLRETKRDSSIENALRNDTNEKIIEYTFGKVEKDSSIENAPILRKYSKQEPNIKKLVDYNFVEAEPDFKYNLSTETTSILRNISPNKETNGEKLIEYTFGEAEKDPLKESTPRAEKDEMKVIEYTFGEAKKNFSIEPTPILRKSSRQEEKKQRIIKYAFGEDEYDYSMTESTPILRKSSRQEANTKMKKKENMETRKVENEEKRKKEIEKTRKKEYQEKAISEYIFGDTERAELIDVDRQLYDTEKKEIKRQVYKTTFKFKRNNMENNKIVEEVFIIEHTFKSRCRKCPNHENDSVSCKMRKLK